MPAASWCRRCCRRKRWSARNARGMFLRNQSGSRRSSRCHVARTRFAALAVNETLLLATHPTEHPMTTTSGSAKWQGGIKDGKGAISTKSGALKDYPYGFASRFEGKPGSNPEELIGAAHAACFTMALSLILGEAKLDRRADGNQSGRHAGEAGRRFCHHLGASDADRENSRRRTRRSSRSWPAWPRPAARCRNC